MSNGSTTQLFQSLRRQQDWYIMMQRPAMAIPPNNLKYWNAWCHRYTPLSIDLFVLVFTYPRLRKSNPRTLSIINFHVFNIHTKASPTLDRALTSARRYQGTAYNSQCAKVNYPNVTTSATIYTEADRGVPPSVNFSNPFSFPTIPSLFQLLKPPSPFDGLIQRPLMPHYDEVAQDYVPILRVSQYCGLVTVYPYPDNENVSSFGQPPFAHYATTGPMLSFLVIYTTPVRGWAGHHQRMGMHDSTPNVLSYHHIKGCTFRTIWTVKTSQRSSRGQVQFGLYSNLIYLQTNGPSCRLSRISIGTVIFKPARAVVGAADERLSSLLGIC
ncbi:hypothetical protein EDC04DRAFT_2613275 [Pisolithus marmoratus]|nr:hypothetical protein EDC04DRAFT_2613275 [Pisolithus marmoratus]